VQTVPKSRCNGPISTLTWTQTGPPETVLVNYSATCTGKGNLFFKVRVCIRGLQAHPFQNSVCVFSMILASVRVQSLLGYKTGWSTL